MSRSIDLFIDCQRPMPDVAGEISRLSGFALTPDSEEASWSLDDGAVHAELRTHPYVDDGDLHLGRYRFALSSRVPSDTRLADAPETALLRMVSEALQKGGMPTLLVHDLQYRDQHLGRLTTSPATASASSTDSLAGDPASLPSAGSLRPNFAPPPSPAAVVPPAVGLRHLGGTPDQPAAPVAPEPSGEASS